MLAAFKPVVAEADKSTVRVYCDGSETVLGTVVGTDGWIATKYSELREPISCLINGKQLPAKLVGYDQPYDLAMLKIDAKDLKVVDWSDDEKGPVVGQFVATAAPGELPSGIGVVSVPRRAIPIHDAHLARRALEDGGPGAKIAMVDLNTPAAKAGLQAGDVVMRADNMPISNFKQFSDMIHERDPGDKVVMVVHRGDEELNITAVLAAPRTLPPSRSDRMNQMGSKLSKLNSGFAPVIQHDTVLQSKECGGPLVDLTGKVVGINIARAGRVESYAVPADQVRAILADMESGKLAAKTMLAGTTDAKPADKVDEKPAEAKAEK